MKIVSLFRLVLPLLIVLTACADAQTILLHMGFNEQSRDAWEDNQGRWWNLMGTWQATYAKNNLVDMENTPTQVTWSTTSRFSFFQGNGPIEDDVYHYPDKVSSNGFFLSDDESPAKGEFRNLDTDKLYTLTFYGATIIEGGGGVARRALVITVSGDVDSGNQLLLLDAANAGESAFNEVTFENIRPDDDGRVYVEFLLPEGYRRGTINAITLTANPDAQTQNQKQIKKP